MLNEIAFFCSFPSIEVALDFTNYLVLIEPVRETLGLDHQVYKLTLLGLCREVHGHVFVLFVKENFCCVERYFAVFTLWVRQYVEAI